MRINDENRAAGRGKVLLCEDEAIVALDIQMMIEDCGFEVVGPFARVSAALKEVDDDDVVAAVLDVRLRDGEVFPVADRLHERGVPLIFHSGHIIEDDVAGRFPDAEHCPKPINCKALMSTLERVAQGQAPMSSSGGGKPDRAAAAAPSTK